MNEKQEFLHFGKIEVKFKNNVFLKIIADAYPSNAKENKKDEKELKKKYDDNLSMEIKANGDIEIQYEGWLNKFKELLRELSKRELSKKDNEIEDFLKKFFSNLSENYGVREFKGIDIPLIRKKDGGKWVIDENNSISIVLFSEKEEKDKKLKIFDRFAIRITENANYDVETKDNYKISISTIETSKDFIRTFGEKENKCRICFEGYTFFGNIFVLKEKEIVARLPLLVFPLKISPEEAEEIVNELLFSKEEIVKKSPTHLFLDMGGKIKKTPVQTLILIHNLFSERKKGRVPLGKTLRAISSFPDKALIKEKVEKLAHDVSSFDEESIFESILQGDIKRSNSNIYHFEYENKKYFITTLKDEITRITFDTFPNRFVKYFVNFLKNTINSCVKRIKGEEKREFIKDEFVESLIKRVLDLKKKYITPFLNLEWMEEVSRITYLPPPSQKLLKDLFYSSAFFDYLDLIKNLKIVDEELEKYLQNPITWMPELYELWCGIKLKEIAEEARAKFKRQRKYIEKKNDAKNNESEWFSYSVPLIPDFTLEKNSFIFLFDAKYRVEFGEMEKIINEEKSIKEEELRGTFKLGDLYKMHTYREAIRRKKESSFETPLFVFILYPGDEFRIFFMEEEIKKERIEPGVIEELEKKLEELKKSEKLKNGGVGAIPFKPSLLKDKEYRNLLIKLIS